MAKAKDLIKPRNIYKGDSLRESLLAYSRDRMDRDPQYKREVIKKLREARQKRKDQEKKG